MRIAIAALLAIAIVPTALSASDPAAAATEKRSVPYWASIGPGQARMRTGPARTYPASWLYQRAGLPVQVVGVFKEWRRIRDQDGTEGWMQGNLLRLTRTAVVTGTEPAPMRLQPAERAAIAWRAAPGVVGRISDCGHGWCRFDVKGRAGYVEVGSLWGVEATEILP